MSKATKFPAHVIRAISVKAHRDPRSVVNAIEGRAKDMVKADVFAAMAELGLSVPAATVVEGAR